MKAFARKIRDLREMSGLSQFQIEAKTGINRSTVSLFENGHRTPTPEQAQELIRVLSEAVRERAAVAAEVADSAEGMGVPA